jgi:acyl-CoA synthetase (AMP-forming)/AMP-acid ligase II
MIVDGPALANGLVRPLDERTAAPTAREVVSVGSPVPGVEVELRDEEGAVVADKVVGRIFVKSPALMQGYFGEPEATAAVLNQGWLDTGDLGFVNGSELFIAGRAKDLVIIRGANHPPQEFEECLAGIEGLRPGCAVALGFVPPGSASENGGEELLILAERSENEKPAGELTAGIRDAVLERTGIQVHTIQLLLPGTLPRTSSGKMRRREALRRFLANELEPPKPVNAFRLIGEMAASTLALARASLGRGG